MQAWFLALILVLSLGAESALAQTMTCQNKILPPRGILYKPENVHGGRGPSYIMGYVARRSWPAGRSLNIFNFKGTRIGAFGLFDPGHLPYGRRYYTGVPGGSYSSARSLYRSAGRVGSRGALVQVNPNTCWKILNPLYRQGDWK